MNAFFQYFPFAFTLFKTFFLNKRHDHKVKNFNKTAEKVNTIENMLVKVEKKLRETRTEIEEIRRQILFSRVIMLIMGMLIIGLIIFK